MREIQILRVTRDEDKGDKVNDEKVTRTWIGKYSSATERALKNADRGEHEAWAYLDERRLGRAVRLQRILFDYLPGTISIRG